MFIKNNKKLLKLVSAHYNTDLSEVVLIGCQHILGTTVDLLKELFSDGLSPSNTYLIGKCYSTNDATFNKIQKMGIYIDSNSRTYNSHLSYDEQFKSFIEEFVHDALKKIEIAQFRKIILLDDGGQLLSCFNTLENIDFHNVSGVEQTSSGFEKISKTDLQFPVINIARSKTKLEVESPIIANIVTKELRKFFNKYHLSHPKILIVGNGNIGKNIFKLLNVKYSVDSYDLMDKISPFPGDIADRINQYDVIIGTTGRAIMSGDDFKLLKPNSYLISASSSDREFSAWEIRKNIPMTNDCHHDINNNEVVIANGGFPINFTGRVHSAPPNEILLTRSLLLAGVLEANSQNYPPGIIELPVEIQKIIVNNFH